VKCAYSISTSLFKIYNREGRSTVDLCMYPKAAEDETDAGAIKSA
jgi:hypothetical protein